MPSDIGKPSKNSEMSASYCCVRETASVCYSLRKGSAGMQPRRWQARPATAYSKRLTSPAPRRMICGLSPISATMLDGSPETGLPSITKST